MRATIVRVILHLPRRGLKSMILGEDQILGQVKDAHEFAKEHLCCGKYLNTLFRISVTGAKKCQTETLLSKLLFPRQPLQ